MGIFDAFTGKPGKEAAAKNAALLAALKTEGNNYLTAGYDSGADAYGQAIQAFEPLSALAGKYGGGTSTYLDSLGINGQEGNARAVGAFQQGPGYQFAMDQGLDALDRRASSRGQLASGGNNLDTLKFSQGLANQEYGGWQNRLGGLVAPELSATGGAATGTAAGYGSLGALSMQDALARVGLASNVTGGQMSNNNMLAQTQMGASGNILGLGMNLLKLGAGFGLPSFGGFGGGSSGGSLAI